MLEYSMLVVVLFAGGAQLKKPYPYQTLTLLWAEGGGRRVAKKPWVFRPPADGRRGTERSEDRHRVFYRRERVESAHE